MRGGGTALGELRVVIYMDGVCVAHGAVIFCLVGYTQIEHGIVLYLIVNSRP